MVTCTLADFAIGALPLAIMAPFKGTTQNQNLFLQKDIYFLPTQNKKKILQLGIHRDPVKCDLGKIMGRIRYHAFQNLN